VRRVDGAPLSAITSPDELAKLSNKIMLTRAEVVGQLEVVIKRRTRILAARCNTHELAPEIAARELAAYRLAVAWVSIALPEPPAAVPVCEDCGSADVEEIGPDTFGTEFHCRKCDLSWSQPT
jgi:hypothetical protein